jgi:hypothetical protein
MSPDVEERLNGRRWRLEHFFGKDAKRAGSSWILL